MRHFSGDRLVIATHNAGKLEEVRQALGVRGPSIVAAGELGLQEPEETGSTFEENAALKARAAALASGCVALADDSGLCVAGLEGRPGIYSARWAGPNKDFHAAMERIFRELGQSGAARAAFVCVLALAWPDGQVQTVEGRCEGSLLRQPRGDKGMGYDPWFVPEGYDRTFAEMEAEEKNVLSHRGKALAKFMEVFLSP